MAFNWDNIKAGNPEMNDSEKFFSKYNEYLDIQLLLIIYYQVYQIRQWESLQVSL